MMPIFDETKDLSRALDGMKDKTRDLQESLRGLAESGLDPLFKVITQNLSSLRQPAARRPESEIISGTLGGFARQELPHVLGALLGIDAGSGVRGGKSDGGISVIINNNAQASVTAREVSGGDDRKYLEITIDQMVANSLLRGRQTSGVLRSLFGLAPDLIGR